MKNTAQTTQSLSQIALDKASYPLASHMILAFLAGVYIAFGAALAIKVTGNLSPDLGNLTKLIFGALFPVGLLMVLMAGASLFTGDVMYMGAGLIKREVGIRRCTSFLILSYVGNFVGSVFLAWLIFESGVLMDKSGGSYPLAQSAVGIANLKCSLPFLEAFLRGILCNWLVCLAIFMSLTSETAVSKAVLMWPPITAFVALGMEHSVANMFFIPLGLFMGNSPEVIESGVTLTATCKTFLVDNLIPVTLGNIVGGIIFVSLPYVLVSKSNPQK
ncbi:MAG: formate/nitrite transporter family protein [Deltaproteobacteria bacterium]|jgi:formate/nitrite transporter|nr:formate/nitrite transporter family protein [Deltaproteobacteria bacterium]